VKNEVTSLVLFLGPRAFSRFYYKFPATVPIIGLHQNSMCFVKLFSKKCNSISTFEIG